MTTYYIVRVAQFILSFIIAVWRAYDMEDLVYQTIAKYELSPIGVVLFALAIVWLIACSSISLMVYLWDKSKDYLYFRVKKR